MRARSIPDPIAEHLRRVLPGRVETPTRTRLTQSGEMLRRPGEKPLAFSAREELAVREVGFEWRAGFGPNRLVRLTVVDRYRDGEGSLTARVWGLLPVTSSRGPDTDRAEAIRYLAELPWVPHAIARNRDLVWREVDDQTVEVTAEVAGERAALTIGFDSDGDVVHVSALRRRQEGKTFVETPWAGDFSDYGVIDGIRMPATAEVYWDPGGDRFVYWRGRVLSASAR